MVWAPDYVTGAQVKNYLNIQHDDADLFLDMWATAVSRNVDDHCGRQFGQVATVEERIYTATWSTSDCRSYVEIDDLQDITGFAIVDEDDIAITDYRLEPRNAVAKGGVYTEISFPSRYTGDLTLTGKWGWNEVPASIPTAAFLQAARLNARRHSPFGVAGSPTEGSEIRLLAQLDPDFKTSLKPYVRKWFVK